MFAKNCKNIKMLPKNVKIILLFSLKINLIIVCFTEGNIKDDIQFWLLFELTNCPLFLGDMLTGKKNPPMTLCQFLLLQRDDPPIQLNSSLKADTTLKKRLYYSGVLKNTFYKGRITFETSEPEVIIHLMFDYY